MGIPSYYKRLSNSIKGLVVPHQNDKNFKVNTLLFDFNCMIYQIIRSPDVPPFPGYNHPDADAWERNICQRVADYTVNVWNEVGKPKKVFLGLDGVVPMAKIRQQRLRRFKSIWTANDELARGLRTNEEHRWDTNAITPGTAFMEKLGTKLKELCKSIPGWTLSDTNCPGEGEQKCMAFWRKNVGETDNLVIYGLDADLILLCLLTKQLLQSKESVWCIRESAEWENKNKKGDNTFMRLSIDKLFDALWDTNIPALDWTMDYVAGMNFLGNDFVPHGISLKIREGGHDQLLDNLKDLHSSGKRLAKQEGGIWTYHFDGVCFLAKLWAEAEEKKLLEFIKNKHHKINYEDSQMLPCQWAEENKVLCEERGKLYTDWETRMVSEWFGQGVTMRQVCDAYANSLQWILDYYTAQRETDMTWIYPWSLPPSWNGWLRYCIERPNSFTDFKCQQTTIIQPQEQLAMVLPLESWHFLRDAKLTRLPELFPQFWPSKFGFFSAGKIFMWECEAELPLLHLPVVRSVS